MSIVERAIRRLQGEVPVSQARRVFGRVVETAAPEATTRRQISIDQDALRTAGLLAPRHRERQIASQYRQIKRPLIAAAMGKGREQLPNGRLIMVASAMPGEGKTFTAINLAFSMAMEKDLHVVLVDADLAKPQISKMFGIEGEQGLLDAVTESTIDMELLILPTDVPNLFLLPAGKSSDHATELLASDRMSEAIGLLLHNDPARVILFDSPPLLLTTEASALAQLVGQVVVVVHADNTEQQTLSEALSHLPEGTSASLILNQSTAKDAGSYFYGYGSQEGV
jgi:protein-tyrosine kinase